MKVRYAVPVLLLALGACSAKASPPAVASIASQAGCVGFQQDTSFLLYAREHGDCKVAGQDITVVTFNDSGGQANYLKIGKSFGGIYGRGKLWLIEGHDSAAVAQATKAAGGVAG